MNDRNEAPWDEADDGRSMRRVIGHFTVDMVCYEREDTKQRFTVTKREWYELRKRCRQERSSA